MGGDESGKSDGDPSSMWLAWPVTAIVLPLVNLDAFEGCRNCGALIWVLFDGCDCSDPMVAT